AALEEEYAAKRVEIERRESEGAAAERAFAKETESIESLKATLEEQETAFLSDLQDIKSRKAALEKSEAARAQETKKLEQRSGTGRLGPRKQMPNSSAARKSSPESRKAYGASADEVGADERDRHVDHRLRSGRVHWRDEGRDPHRRSGRHGRGHRPCDPAS